MTHYLNSTLLKWRGWVGKIWVGKIWVEKWGDGFVNGGRIRRDVVEERGWYGERGVGFEGKEWCWGF